MKHPLMARSFAVIACVTAIAGSPWVTAQAAPFTPPPNDSAPSEATGGASRGSTFVPPQTNSAPQQSTGGASRSVFAPPVDNATPQQTTGGASRSNLQGNYINAGGVVSMTALTPESFYGTTLSERPTFMVYVPASNAREMVFSLKDADDNMHYQMRLAVSSEAGMVAIQLPADAPALEMGKNYHWYLALLVDGSMSPSTPFVDAWVQRIEATPQLQQALAQGNDLQDAEALATQSVWYDSVSLLAQLRSTAPNNEAVASSWSELLNSVNLAKVLTVTNEAVR